MLQSKLPQNAKSFIKILAHLSDRDRNLLIERFIKNKSMKEVAIDFKITDTRVQQIEDSIIKHIDETFSYINSK
jgi:DNA-directed RNA polymerase specialized sigma subunit|tara:strand:+ start:890 stop:1111 length:222 start_codon:yes stop_codon:yes gene_type:complete